MDIITSYLLFTVFANTAYIGNVDGTYTELCVVTINQQASETYVGECERVGAAVRNELLERFPAVPVQLIINGNNLNEV